MLSPLNQESESAAHAFLFAAESEKLMKKERRVPCLHVSSLLFWKSPNPNVVTQAKK